ncbi:TIGR01459 family HAD-type hydrolase [Robiginitomaculum antarcticum]|uniref:TIGR01459 family HAD-type hydrolase n=1 Tax=Robiginitomaculum antarcticum TaxID=437507 RepID=UPI00035EA15C|nr:TIGR01459 family HAD-type hydrolase [Robiginitomaculum antarcticum]
MAQDFIPISGLGQIADDYDVLICDIWGVIHNGKVPFFEACEALNRFRQSRGTVVLVSNSPRPSRAIPEQLDDLRVPEGIYDAIVTSGDATIDELSRRAPGPVFKLGPDRDDRIYEGLELHFSGLDEAEFISCTGLFEDDHETPDDYTELLSQARDNGLPMVCANPDIRVKRGDHMIYCGGALAQKYEDMGGEVIYAGKPHSPIYRLSRAWLEEVLGYVPGAERILAIGDNIHTDLLGAQNENFDCLFIADGMDTANSEAAFDLIRDHGISARYVMGSLEW